MSASSTSPLVDPREERYFVILLVISILVWALVVLTCFTLPYVLLIGLFLWMANGLLVARLRSEGVEVTPEQEPALYQALVEVCGKLGLTTIPRLYIIQSGGALNAFTTRHSSRQFIVLYSDMLEACGSDSAEIRFVLGHEIGHIQRNHLSKNLLVLPGRILPLIGDAYSRACERTCDRYGAAGTTDVNGAVRAMMMLSAGPEYGKTLRPEAFAAQHATERGFFISWHELTSSYPTLSQRVDNLLAIRSGTVPLRQKRHPLAYVFAFFTLSGPGGGFSSLLLTIIAIGFIAALFIPDLEHALPLPKVPPAQDEAVEYSEPVVPPDVLERGVIDKQFVGTWTATIDDLTWDTIRREDGTFESFFTEGTGADSEKWQQTGQWRVLDGTYYEISGHDEKSGYPIVSKAQDVVVFGDSAAGPHNTYSETRKR